MKISDIEKVLLEQQDELEALESEVLIHRPEEDLINLNSKLAQGVIGVRRSGKSKLLEAFKNVHTGITEEVCAPEIRHQTIVLFDKCIK